jgi:hypothetical protein
VWRAGYIPGDRLTSWVYSTNCVQYLYVSCYLSDNKRVLSYLLLCLLPQWSPRSGCTLYFCTLTPRQPSAPVALSSAFVSDFLFQVLQCALHTTFTAFSCLRFCLEINSFFPKLFFFLLEVSRELPQCSTLNTFFIAPSFLIVRLHSLTLFALTFLCLSHPNLLIFVLFQTCHTFVNPSILLPYSSWDECPTNLWTLPIFSSLTLKT